MSTGAAVHSQDARRPKRPSRWHALRANELVALTIALTALLAACAAAWAVEGHARAAELNALAAALLAAFSAGPTLAAGALGAKEASTADQPQQQVDRGGDEPKPASSPASPRRHPALTIALALVSLVVLGSNVAAVAAATFAGPGGKGGSGGGSSSRVTENAPKPESASSPAQKAAEEREQLARQMAPVLRLHSSEVFVPLDRGRYLSVSDLRKRQGGSDHDLPFIRQEASLPETSNCNGLPNCGIYLDIDGAKPSDGPKPYLAIQNLLFPTAITPTVYWNAHRYPNGRMTLQYWFLYLFNDFKNSHESDWEHITVLLITKIEQGKVTYVPDTAYYSSHEGGLKRPWSSLGRVGADHPTVFVAGGSHADYFAPGNPRVHVCKGTLCDVLVHIRDHADGCGRILLPPGLRTPTAAFSENCRVPPQTLSYELRRLQPPAFAGDYAAGNFIGPFKRQAQYPDPQRRTPSWSDPFSELAGAAVDPAYLQALKEQ